MTASAVIVWAAVAWCLVMVALSTWQHLRNRQAHRKLATYWQRTAPPVPPIQVRLVTGETITVEPEGPQQTWAWFAHLPPPNMVDEVLIPELPPWTTVVPVPGDWPRLKP